MLDITFAKPSLPQSGALVLLIAEGDKPSGLWKQADEATGGAIGRALEVAEFKGGKGKTCAILAPGAGLSRVLAVGLGKSGDLKQTTIEAAGGAIVAALGREETATVATGGLKPAQAAEVALGAVLRGYRFDRYRTKEKAEDKPKLASLTIATSDPAKANTAWGKLKGVANGVFVARDLVSEPPNVLNPAEMAKRCEALAELGLTVEVMGPEEMGKLGFGALLGVAQGSVNEARMVVMHWNGAGGKKSKDKPVVFVGKGVTFDTGGISIKPAGGMEDMKWDMAGAGAVFGAMKAIAGRKAKANVIGVLALAENMPDGNAQRPGDIVTSLSGQTIEVLNTDAEGRLVLADALWFTQDRFKPRLMIDLATLTGAVIVALGSEYAGLFSNSDELVERLQLSGKAVGENLWRLPLGDSYDREIDCDAADMKNISSGREAGSTIGAVFLQRFVNSVPWAHLDIAGVAWSKKDKPTVPKGATGYGVRLLDRLVAQYYED